MQNIVEFIFIPIYKFKWLKQCNIIKLGSKIKCVSKYDNLRKYFQEEAMH